MNPYSKAKALRHLDILSGMVHHRWVRPAHIHLIPSDVCNERCSYCSYRDPDYTTSKHFLDENKKPFHRMLPASKIHEIIEDCAELGTCIEVTGGGEPTTHPEIKSILEHMKKVPYAVDSNGTLVLSKNIVEEMAHAAWVRITLDTADPEVYTRLRGATRAHQEQAIAGLKEIVRVRDAQKTNCVIGVACIVGKETYPGIEKLAYLCREIGVDNLSLAPQYSMAGEATFEGFREEMLKACRKAEKIEGEHFRVLNRVPNRLLDMHPPTYSFCGLQFFTTYIAANAQVYRCCATSYNDRGLLGSIEQKTFKEFWFSQERLEKMYSFDARQCDRCPYREQNYVLESVMTPQLHEEFV